MGYESKVFVVMRKEHDAWCYGDEIATFDLSKMGYEQVDGRSFPTIFDVPIDFDLYINDERTKEDCYGAHCGMTSVERVIEWLEKSEVAKEYRRAKLFLAFLYALRERKHEFVDEIVLVHYGY